MDRQGDNAEVPGDNTTIEFSEPEVIGMDVICRLCANQSERIIGIYSEEGISNDLANKMNLYLPIKVSESDSLPLQCCWSCASTVLAWHELVIASVEADRRLRGLQIVPEKSVVDNEQYEESTEVGSMSVPEERCKEEVNCLNATVVKTEYTDEIEFPEELATNCSNFGTDSEHEVEFFRCAECPVTFATEKCLVIHQLQIHGLDSSVSKGIGICKRRFTSCNKMLHHVKQEHRESTFKKCRRARADIQYKIFCDICRKGFTRLNDMNKHKLRKHRHLSLTKDNCKQDTKIDKLNTEFNGDVALSTQNQCNFCHVAYTKKTELHKHLRNDHGQILTRFRRKQDEIVAEHFCNVCNKGFTRKFDMQKHKKQKHPDEPEIVKEPTQQQKTVELLKRCKVEGDNNRTCYKCETCGRIFRQSYNFMRHQSIHTGVRAFFCHICGKSFRMSGGLRRHITEHHYGVKKFACDICNRSFAAKATRDEHRNIHTNVRPFVCDTCGKAFKQKASLHIHKMFHTDNYRFTCNICGKKYRRASDLKVHSWLHSGHKPHTCDICGANFRLRQDLKRHSKIHDKSNECVCAECGLTFSQERYLKNHKKIHKVKTVDCNQIPVKVN